MLLPFALGALSFAQGPADVLAEVERALAGASPVVVRATLSRTQALTWQSHLAEATITIDRARGAFRVDARVRELRGEERHDLTLAKEDGRFFFLDHTRKTFRASDSPALGGLPGRLCLDLARLMPAEPSFLAQKGSPALGTPVTLAGKRCLVLTAETPDGPTAHTWYLAQDDFLPRLWETSRSLGEGDTLKKRFTVQELRTGSAALPVFTVPAAYTLGPDVAWEDPEERSRRSDAGRFVSLADGIDALRAEFNAGKDKVRALGLFAPT